MPQANAARSSISMLDAIAPSRNRLNVLNNPTPSPANATMAAIRLGAEMLAASGPIFPEVPKAPRSPYVTHYGKVIDPIAHAHWVMAQRKEGAR